MTPILQYFERNWDPQDDATYLHKEEGWKIAPRSDGNSWVLYRSLGETWVPILNGDLSSAVHYVMTGGD